MSNKEGVLYIVAAFVMFILLAVLMFTGIDKSIQLSEDCRKKCEPDQIYKIRPVCSCLKGTYIPEEKSR